MTGEATRGTAARRRKRRGARRHDGGSDAGHGGMTAEATRARRPEGGPGSPRIFRLKAEATGARRPESGSYTCEGDYAFERPYFQNVRTAMNQSRTPIFLPSALLRGA